MKARVDKTTCIGCGQCEGICPEVFKMADDGLAEVIVDRVPAEAEARCREAMEGCPAGAISVQDD